MADIGNIMATYNGKHVLLPDAVVIHLKKFDQKTKHQIKVLHHYELKSPSVKSRCFRGVFDQLSLY